jgi:hypothetical protein
MTSKELEEVGKRLQSAEAGAGSTMAALNPGLMVNNVFLVDVLSMSFQNA